MGDVFQKEEQDGNNNRRKTILVNNTGVIGEDELQDSQCSVCQSWYTSREVAADCKCSKMAKCRVILTRREDIGLQLLTTTKDIKFVSMKDERKVYQLTEKPKFVGGEWICYKCGDKFKSVRKCYAHLETVHEVDLAIFTCNVCVYKCDKRQPFDTHMKTVKHEKNKKLYKRGVLKVGENDSVVYQCQACQENFPLLRLYSDHLKVKKDNSKCRRTRKTF